MTAVVLSAATVATAVFVPPSHLPQKGLCPGQPPSVMLLV